MFTALKLKFQTESFMFELFILLSIKLKKERLITRLGTCVNLGEQLQMLHLFIEISTIEFHIKNGLIQRLQFPNSKLLGQ